MLKTHGDQRNQEGTTNTVCVPQCLHEPYLSHDVAVSMAGGEVQGRVVSAVHDVDARPSHDEHVHHAGAALPAGPVERAEAVVISTVREENSYSAQDSQKPSQPQQGLRIIAGGQAGKVAKYDLRERKV